MTILATSLFGSRARGDWKSGSDIDVLCWTDDPFPRHVRPGPLAIAYYPRTQLLGQAAVGDLFAAHLAFEAIEIHDPDGLLRELRRAYAPPPTYEPHVRAASDLAWFLIDHSTRIGAALFNARSAWCVRTIAIARSAENGRLAFSADDLAELLGPSSLLDIVADKDRPDRSRNAVRRLSGFIRRFGRDRPLGTAAPAHAYKKRFRLTGNEFGLKTVRISRMKDDDGAYV